MPRLLLIALLSACGAGSDSAASAQSAPAPAAAEGQGTAYFAGGCFWCMEKPFEELEGVSAVVSGYIGGEQDNPTYRQVSSGGTGHAEAVRIVYDPDVITYARLLEVFWHNVDPTDAGGQFCDRGSQYRTGIFVSNAEERRLAEASKQHAAQTLDRPIVTEITDATRFYDAEDYHQNFYRTNPLRYNSYRQGCGRDARLRQLWGESAAH
ncbi:MAG: peptide-methionine (S)-S-oxide reductase MsrA [Myxococcota bacterium]